MNRVYHHYTHERLLKDSPYHEMRHENQKITNLGVCVAAAITMVAVIIIMLISILKCFRRSNRSPNHHATAEQSHCAELAAVLGFTYGAPPSPSSSKSCSSTFESENCAICLAEFLHGEAVKVLPRCKHLFHKDCIDQWLPQRSSHCPICRDRTIEHEVKPTTTNCRTNEADHNLSALLAFNFANAPLPASSVI